MKKLSVLVVLLFTFVIQLSAQTDKKDTLILNDGKMHNTNIIDRLKVEAGIDQLSKALVLVDGKVYKNNLDSLNAQSIESLSVNSPSWGANHYGKAGENGVIIIKLKKNTLTKKV